MILVKKFYEFDAVKLWLAGADTIKLIQNLNAIVIGNEQDIRRSLRKQTVGDNAGKAIQFLFQLNRLKNTQVMHIENDVAVIRGKAFT